MPLSAEKKKTEPEHVSELTVAEALSLAIRTHQTGYLDNAETLYRRILAAAPDQSDALHFLGVLLHQRGRSEEGLAFIRLDRLGEAMEAHADGVVIRIGAPAYPLILPQGENS